MKTINIQHRHKKQKTIEICLGNGSRLLFTSKRNANAYLAETNRFLTKCLVVLNATYSSLFAEYRDFWLVSSNTNGGTRTNYNNICNKVKSNLDAAGDIFDKFNLQYKSIADPYFSFIDLRKVCIFLSEAAKELQNIHKKRNHTANYYNCMVLNERLLLTMEKLLNYGNA